MRIVVAPDKLKGSLSAVEAAAAIARGVRRAEPETEVEPIPMADGGEGTVEALVASTAGSFRTERVSGPLREPVEARFGLSSDRRTAFVEMAAASGLVLVPADRRDPTRATTLGTGELIRAALDAGARRIVVGIGGSATNDGGVGMARALGYRFLDAEGREIEPTGGDLERLEQIDDSERDPRLDEVELEVACDVTNPLIGPRGASAVYGPQKGADEAMVARLDRNLARLATIIEHDLGRSIAGLPGSGAAGGLGGGLVAFAQGRLRPGIDLVIEAVGLGDRLRGADLCLTAEGAIDAQTAQGKTISGVARTAQALGVPVIALGGAVDPDARPLLDQGVAAYFSLCPRPLTLEEAVADAAALLEAIAEQAFRAFRAGDTQQTIIITRYEHS